ncbi:MAG: hypothetical protein H0U43_09255 [Chthoniobacterales bacterium]|nr:hypothetical protein [Chthoniobacterales bacterium]
MTLACFAAECSRKSSEYQTKSRAASSRRASFSSSIGSFFCLPLNWLLSGLLRRRFCFLRFLLSLRGSLIRGLRGFGLHSIRLLLQRRCH